jgi:hypothetical protein
MIHEAKLPTVQSQTTLCHNPTHRRTKQRIMGAVIGTSSFTLLFASHT